MKKIFIISIVAVCGISAFGFALKPSGDQDTKQSVAIKVGAEKSGFTETTGW